METKSVMMLCNQRVAEKLIAQDETLVTALGNAIWQTFNVRYLDE